MKKRFWVILMSCLMVIPVICGFSACGKDDGINITVWVGEGTEKLTKELITEFNDTNDLGVKFNATVEMVSESKAAGDALSKKDSAADIFCFAQDQLARLVQGQMLMTLGSSSTTFIEENNSADSVEAAKIGGEIKAFPLTADNGYMMFYDKSVVKAEHIGSLEDILDDCKAAGKNFSMNLTKEGGAWYAMSFFYATGCKSEWTIDNTGKFINYDDTLNSPEGITALKGIRKVLTSGVYSSSSEASEFNAATKSAVLISGIWSYKAAKTALGDNLGVAHLPSFWVDANENEQKDEGESYQMVSYLGYKMLGIKPQKDAQRSRYLQALAQFLTNKQSQMKRYQEVSWGPSNKELAADSTIDNECLQALKGERTVSQGQYPTNWWSELLTVVGGVEKGSEIKDSTMSTLLTTYQGNLPGVMTAG